MNLKLVELIKEIQYNTPLRRYFFPRYQYMFTPPQLCFLCQCIEETKEIEGSCAEIGCADGTTTIFLNKYIDARNIQKNYYAIDTFSGFVADDIEFEVMHRGKQEDYFTSFQVNKKKWFDGTMQTNNISRVHSIQADVNKYDLRKLGPLSFVLLDVDLYRPVKKCLPYLYETLSPGGIIVADDCDFSYTYYDGAAQAYKEFMQEMDLVIQILYGKMGIIRKDA